MSTIEEVRQAERKVNVILDALRKTGAKDPNHLHLELQKASDEYAKAVRELGAPSEQSPRSRFR